MDSAKRKRRQGTISNTLLRTGKVKPISVSQSWEAQDTRSWGALLEGGFHEAMAVKGHALLLCVPPAACGRLASGGRYLGGSFEVSALQLKCQEWLEKGTKAEK